MRELVTDVNRRSDLCWFRRGVRVLFAKVTVSARGPLAIGRFGRDWANWAGFRPNTVTYFTFSFTREILNRAKIHREFRKWWDKFCRVSKINICLVTILLGFVGQSEIVK